jgi:hypothetical protein
MPDQAPLDHHRQFMHVACTEFLTAMHAGDQTKEAIDADSILPG